MREAAPREPSLEDYWETNERLQRGLLSQQVAQNPEYFQRKITRLGCT